LSTIVIHGIIVVSPVAIGWLVLRLFPEPVL